MHRAVQSGAKLPDTVTEDEYQEIRAHGEDWLKGFVGFGLSYSGKYWRGYARGFEGRNYCTTAKNGLLKKHATMKDVLFSEGPYNDCILPELSLVYCDIPYRDTTSYSTGKFKHDEFYAWASNKRSEGHNIFVSEYAHNVPAGWSVVWECASRKYIRNADNVQEQTKEVIISLL